MVRTDRTEKPVRLRAWIVLALIVMGVISLSVVGMDAQATW